MAEDILDGFHHLLSHTGISVLYLPPLPEHYMADVAHVLCSSAF